MYTKFFGFKEKPFNNSPDPKFFYPSSKHMEALDRLLYAIYERKGFVVVTGEIGSGKTTVCRTLLNKLDAEDTEIAIITNTHLNSKDLIVAILEDLEIKYERGTKIRLLTQLNDYLMEKLKEEKNVILIIDEAQNLTPSVLEEVRMLSNLETDTEKLIQIVLLGQPQLRDKLKLKKLEQFRQRVAIHYHLYPLTEEETQNYIKHRLSVVSNEGVADIFNQEALSLIYEFSQGTPRLINYACDSALLSGFVAEKKTIDRELVMSVVDETHMRFNAFEDKIMEDGKAHIKEKRLCCNLCQKYKSCKTKWFRVENGEPSHCCRECALYNEGCPEKENANVNC